MEAHKTSAATHIKDLNTLSVGDKLLNKFGAVKRIVIATIEIDSIVLLCNIIIMLLDVILREPNMLFHLFFEFSAFFAVNS
jgi:hypothetical protein